MKPMLLARENPDTTTLPYPVYAFPKLDGIRCVIVEGKAKSRTLKDIPNLFIQQQLNKLDLTGLDGELIVGSPTSSSVYRDTHSVVMSHDKVVDFTYYVFDVWNHSGSFTERYGMKLPIYFPNPYIQILTGKEIHSETGLLEYEQACLELGYEGVIIRCKQGCYKFGRTTMNEQNTYKLKRFVDDEAVIVGFEEEMHNGNEAEVNELGRTKRSISKAGLSGKGTLGAFVCRTESGIVFNIGSGYSREDRMVFWGTREELLGKTIKYKHFPIGVKIAPRHPIFLGFRDKIDM